MMACGASSRKISVSWFFIAFITLLACSSDDVKDPVVVENEDVFINEVYASGDDWLELYNAGASDKNVGGYLIYDDASNKYTIPANTNISSKGFLVLMCDDTGTGLHTNFKLTSDGETVYLETPAGKLIDKVEFSALGEGQSYGRYPDGTANLAVSGNTTQGSSNGATQAPAIFSTTRNLIVPALNDAVIINTTLVSTAGVTSVKLFYRLNSGTFTEVAMTNNGGIYSASVPAQNTTGKVEYYVEVKNNTNQTSLDPVGGPGNVYSYLLNTDTLPKLYINEFMSANTSCCPDTESGADEFDDWIEIYNAGGVAVNIGGMYLSDNKQNPFKYRMPDDNPAATTIVAGGFLLLWADGSKSQGARHLDFSLANTGEDVGIYYIDGRTIDQYTFGAQAENISTGRSPDGGATWVNFPASTKGTSNN